MKSLGSTTITTTKHTKEIEIEKFIQVWEEVHSTHWELPHGEIRAGCR